MCDSNTLGKFQRFDLVLSAGDLPALTLAVAAFLPEPVREAVGDRGRRAVSDG